MEKNIENIESEMLSVVMNNMKKLYSIWDQIGLSQEKKNNRCEKAWEYITQLSEDIYNEENATYNSLLLRIKDLWQEVSELSKQLLVPCDEEIQGLLLEKEEILRKKWNDLRQQKEERIKKYQELHAVQLKFCQLIGWKPLELCSKSTVPSLNDISKIEQYVSTLKTERNVRFQRLCSAKRELTTILEVTEIQPETPLEKKIFCCSENDIFLSDESLKSLEEVVKKVKSKQADMEKEKMTLLKKLSDLWGRLEISESEKNDFLAEHNDYKASTLQSIKEEIDRCEEVKRKNLKTYICNLREELKSLWKTCFTSDEKKKNFTFFELDDFSEESLQAHESEVEKWRIFSAKIESIRKKIEKRDKLWDLLIVLENKERDPNRYQNRRGNLLKEEREKKKLAKDLPALENEIFLAIQKFENENETKFLYHGENYQASVEKQRQERKIEKENEKALRWKKRMLQVENEATLGTPSVKRTLCSVPRSAPSKLLKSSIGVAVYRTPLVPTTRNSPRTVGKKSTKVRLTSVKNCLNFCDQKEVFKETEDNIPLPASEDMTTFSAFRASLNKTSRHQCRSSILTSRKIVGTRISVSNRNKQRNINKSSRKSIRESVLEKS
ncbi:protein regulator of cytokinesis 1-like isoform X2 [Uloborus diversus]|nr:protein regulator of cytokinesis 1-like isoform X2 [Uloborus diversus]